MISLEALQQTQKDCKEAGYTVSARDISYAILSKHYEDGVIAYRCLFGKDYDYNEEYWATYDQTAMMVYLKQYIDTVLLVQRKKKNTDDISFEENKTEIIRLIQETKDKEARGEIDAKQSLDLQTKLRVTLNDKFRVQSEDVEQRIFVQTKFNSICSYCNHEIYVPTKEQLMDKYNLVERNENYM